MNDPTSNKFTWQPIYSSLNTQNNAFTKTIWSGDLLWPWILLQRDLAYIIKNTILFKKLIKLHPQLLLT